MKPPPILPPGDRAPLRSAFAGGDRAAFAPTGGFPGAVTA